MVIKSKKDHQKILNAGFTILRLREGIQAAPNKRVYSVWAKTKDADWHNISISTYSKKKYSRILGRTIKGSTHYSGGLSYGY